MATTLASEITKNGKFSNHSLEKNPTELRISDIDLSADLFGYRAERIFKELSHKSDADNAGKLSEKFNELMRTIQTKKQTLPVYFG